MNLKKKILFVVLLLMFAALIGVPAFLMIQGIKQFNGAKNELGGSVNQLLVFYKKNPFPSEDNIKAEKDNLLAIQSWFEKLVDIVTAGQIERRDSTPSSFLTKYNEIRYKIINKSNKSIDADSSFGFARYAEGSLPVAVDVPRLMQQMLITERLATILIDSSVKKINKIERDEFDSTSSATASTRTTSTSRRGGRRGSSTTTVKKKENNIKPIRIKADAYEIQSFALEFVAKEGVILDVLNRLAQDDLFIVVTGVEFTKDVADLKMPRVDLPEDSEKSESEGDVVPKEIVKSLEKTREQRRVSGPNVDTAMTVRVDLDVYTFFIHKVKDPARISE